MELAPISPFVLSDPDIYHLEQSEGYRIVRRYLASEPSNSFCSTHSPLSSAAQNDFLTHRSVLHSILLPLIQLRQQASHHARDILSESYRNSSADLELAFKGAARGAFSWLQCFIVEEWDWCITSGCPACTVLKVLHAEPFIRIVIAGCRLSAYLQDLIGHRSSSITSHSECDSESSSEDDRLSSGPTLPVFTFFLPTLRQAVEEDEFWGLHFYEDIEARALDLEDAIKDLIAQCCEICNPRSSPNSSHTSSPEARPAADISPLSPHRLDLPASSRPLACSSRISSARVKNSRLAKRQIDLHREEQDWMNKIVGACWKTMVRETAIQRRNGSRLEYGQNLSLDRSASSAAARMRSATA